MRGLRNIENNLLKKMIITVKVVSASQLPKKIQDNEIVDPFVQVELVTTCNRSTLLQQPLLKTKVVTNNGFNPSWNE